MAEQFDERNSSLHRSFSVNEVAHVASNIHAYLEARSWIETYLARPHAKLGRPGAVCPYAPSALAEDSLSISVVRLSADNKRGQIVTAIESHKRAFQGEALSDKERMLQAILIFFPDITAEEAPDLIDRTKEFLKPSFIAQGLMLGEFHPDNQSPGLHNPEFKPLRCSIPMLAIRQIVSTDLVFLNRPEYDSRTRLQYLEAYLSVSNLPQSGREQAERIVASLREEIQHQAASNV